MNGVKISRTKQIYLAAGAVTGWFAVILQFYLQLINRLAGVTETIFRFFSYYTILTNILVAFCFTVLLLFSRSEIGKFLSQPKVLTAVAGYIAFVGLAYHILLRHLWNPEGLQFIVDVLLHSCMPVMFFLYWLIFVPKADLKWSNVVPWMIYPVAYLLWVLFRGVFSGFYPYPFVDVNNLGYHRVLLNDGGLIVAFLLLSLLFVGLGKLISRRGR